MTAPRRRQIVAELGGNFAVSQRRVCRTLGLARSGIRAARTPGDGQIALARRIEELAGIHPRYGYRRIWAVLRRQGWSVNKKAVHRLWRLSGLKLAGPRGTPKRRPRGRGENACHLQPSRGKDDVWTWDFIFDRTADGRSLKWLSLIDEHTRECLALEPRRGMSAVEIKKILAEAVARRGTSPLRMRSDNGPEFAADVVKNWLSSSGADTLYVAPGSPWQNGFAESFHSRLRDEFLERESFESESQARALSVLWKEEYDTERPHSSLGYETPAAYAAKCPRYVPPTPIPAIPIPSEQTHQ